MRITTDEWKEAGLPFEGWLRYVQLDPTAQARLEEKFRCKACREHAGQMYPNHFASPHCKSGGHNHCTCDTCF